MTQGNVHKNMMQVLLGAGAMAEDDLLSKLQECIELHQDAARRAKLKFVDNKEQDKATLDSVISVLNTQLDPLGLKVAKQRSKHDDKQVYYGVVNLRPDDLVKLGTNLDKGEQELFHKIEMAAHNKRLECTPRISSEDATSCLQQLEHGQWLHKSDEGSFSLGIRIHLQRMYTSNGEA